MKALFTLAVLAVLLLAVSASDARAQQSPAANPASYYANAHRYKIAVVDISYVFKEHERFKQQIETMKQKMEALEKQFTEERKAIAQLEEKRNQYKPDTQEWKDLDNEVTRRKADFTVRADSEQKSLMREEANMYYQTYLEVQDAIATFAKKYDIGLVLRFNGDKVDPALRQDIIRGINRPVVYQNSIDITPVILQMVNRSSSAPPAQQGAVSGRSSMIPPRR